MREAAQQGLQGGPAFLDLAIAGLAIAGRATRARGGLARVGRRAVRMPGESVPEDHLVRAAGTRELVPDHRRAALPHRLHVGIDAGERERLASDKRSLVRELDLR